MRTTKVFQYLVNILGYGKGKYTKPRNPIYGFGRIPIIDKINSGQLEEISYVEGEGIGDERMGN